MEQPNACIRFLPAGSHGFHNKTLASGYSLGNVALNIEAGAAQDASFYSQSDFQNNPETISGGLRFNQWWKADGSRAWTVRDSSNRCDQHDVSPAWSITPGDWTNLVTDSTVFNDPRAIQISPDGTKLLFLGGAKLPRNQNSQIVYRIDKSPIR